MGNAEYMGISKLLSAERSPATLELIKLEV